MSSSSLVPNERAGAAFQEMRAAFSEARFSDAAAEFDNAKDPLPWEATLLRARISLKTDHAPHAIALLAEPRSHLDARDEAERLMLLAVAHAASGRFEEADEFFERAAQAGGSRLFPAEFPYRLGRRYLESREPTRARDELAKVRHLKSHDGRVLGDLLETGILSQEERYFDEAHLLIALITYMDAGDRPYIEESIHALRTLAMLARELDEESLREFVQKRASRQAWTDDFRPHQFQTLKAVGWTYALQGDYFNGLRYLKMAGAIAPTTAWRAMTLLDRAYLARCFGEPRWSTEELSEAEDLIASVSWRETHEEERIALVLAAELFAPIDSGKASAFLAQFSELRDSLSPLLLFRYDRRLAALADYASGVVDLQFGNRKAAALALERAWSTYDDIRYDWRAGRTALRLFKLTNDIDWYKRAEYKLRNYRSSWLWQDLIATKQAPRLTRAQREIVRMLYEGKTTKQISEETGRTDWTVQNHVNAALKAFGVPSRSALLAEVIKLGGRLE